VATREYYWRKFERARRRVELIEKQLGISIAALRRARKQERYYMKALAISDEDRAAMIIEKRKQTAARKAKRARRARAFAAEAE
jgi:hypothetical protein